MGGKSSFFLIITNTVFHTLVYNITNPTCTTGSTIYYYIILLLVEYYTSRAVKYKNKLLLYYLHKTTMSG